MSIVVMYGLPRTGTTSIRKVLNRWGYYIAFDPPFSFALDPLHEFRVWARNHYRLARGIGKPLVISEPAYTLHPETLRMAIKGDDLMGRHELRVLYTVRNPKQWRESVIRFVSVRRPGFPRFACNTRLTKAEMLQQTIAVGASTWDEFDFDDDFVHAHEREALNVFAMRHRELVMFDACSREWSNAEKLPALAEAVGYRGNLMVAEFPHENRS